MCNNFGLFCALFFKFKFQFPKITKIIEFKNKYNKNMCCACKYINYCAL